MRKFYVGFISLAAVLVIYLLYSRLGTTTSPDTGERAEFIDTVADSNVTDFNDQVGRIGDVGVGKVEKAYYEDRNDETQELERVWGFERLLSRSRDMLETEKPYMNIYQRSFTSYITADTGNLSVETAVGKTTVKDATFTSNVVVHIVPVGSGGVKESYIYLDDITFLSDKSLLSTANSVKFVSEDARMLGTGLELVYDDLLERLEYLWIFDLDSLSIKSSQIGSISSSKNQAEKTADTIGQAETQQPEGPAVAAIKTTTQTGLNPPVPGKEIIQYYGCLFSKNVLVDSPEQLVFAHDEIFINDILWSKKSGSRPEEVNTDTAAAERKLQSADNTDTNNAVAAKPSAPNEPPDKMQDIIVTCDNGFIIALKDSPKIFEKIYNKAANTTGPGNGRPEKFDRAEGRKTFLARKIDYNAITDDVIATGASELQFYTDDLGPADSNKPPLPVTVTAQQRVSFLPSSNQALFEGGCRCDMIQTDPNFQQQYTLLAPKLTIDLIKDTNDQSSGLAPGIKHFTADGGLVRLQSQKKAGRQLISWTKLESRKFDYDPLIGLFVATGPGIIEMNNSKASDSEKQEGKFSLSKPCIAVVREFETLKYFIQENRIVADAASEGLLIDYFPVVDGKYGKQIKATAGHVEILLISTPKGQTELSTLTASGGIHYEDEDSKNEFVGSKLFYDHEKSEMKITGDRSQPCFYNGALVDKIEYDLKTGKVRTEIVGPAILQLK